MKIIHCCIWGDIQVSDLALSIIDTPHFQRLHYIRQTGMAFKVFPTATTSRFEHSLGVYHITKTFLKVLQNGQPELDLSNRHIELFAIAGLIHDLGHGPFSHVFDIFSTKKNWPSHEERSQILFMDLVSKFKIPLTKEEVLFVIDKVHPSNTTDWQSVLICNPVSAFDMDKLDYILRDNYQFGMHCSLDITRIMNNVKVLENKLCFCNRIFDEIHLLFFIRERLHRSIYRHPKIRYFEKCLLEFMEEYMYWPDVFDVEFFLSLTDHYVLQSFPYKRWQEVETRKYDVTNILENGFAINDTQWSKAFQNLWYYDRKIQSTPFQITKHHFVQFPFIDHI